MSRSGNKISAETKRISWLRPKNGVHNLVTMTKKGTLGEVIAICDCLELVDTDKCVYGELFGRFRGQEL